MSTIRTPSCRARTEISSPANEAVGQSLRPMDHHVHGVKLSGKCMDDLGAHVVLTELCGLALSSLTVFETGAPL
jgi:hypothetical protein